MGDSSIFFRRIAAGLFAVILGGLGAGLSASPAFAGLTLSPLILDMAPDQPARGDVELFNSGTERLYVLVEPAEVVDAGKPTEHRVKDPDPDSLGLLATPSRLILEPGERKFLRIALLKPPADIDRIFRVTVKPVVGAAGGASTGLKVMVGYEMLVIQRPLVPKAKLTGTRAGDAITITNSGDTNAELFQGKQCGAVSSDCIDLPSQRIYPGASVTVKVRPGFKANYTTKVQTVVKTSSFGD